jgi:hypothetical protein
MKMSDLVSVLRMGIPMVNYVRICSEFQQAQSPLKFEYVSKWAASLES